MQLAEFIRKSPLTWEQFAGKCGVSRQTIYLLMRRKHTPTIKTADAIIKASNGVITMDDLRNG